MEGVRLERKGEEYEEDDREEKEGVKAKIERRKGGGRGRNGEEGREV